MRACFPTFTSITVPSGGGQPRSESPTVTGAIGGVDHPDSLFTPLTCVFQPDGRFFRVGRQALGVEDSFLGFKTCLDQRFKTTGCFPLSLRRTREGADCDPDGMLTPPQDVRSKEPNNLKKRTQMAAGRTSHLYKHTCIMYTHLTHLYGCMYL